MSHRNPHLRRRSLPLARSIAFVAAACLASGATAQGTQSSTAQKPQTQPLRLSGKAAINIDGNFNEPAWQAAPLIGGLTQVTPIEGADPTQETLVRLCYDADYLYLAIECREDPDKIFGRQMRRDEFIRFDDVVEFWIDTFNDQRFAFWFQMTAGGSRGDALLADNGNSFNKDWDGIWYGRSRVTDKGWQAEIALPFKTLSFNDDAQTWGFNLRRLRKYNDEQSRWASPKVAYRFFNLSEGGQLTGLQGMQQGLGLDVVPYAKASLNHNNSADDTDRLGEAGLDLRYRLSPSLNFRLTLNTDFAEAEVDGRQINLTRFPLFFPEKRDFFLEDAGQFQFGSPDRRRSLVPFFSRTVGRDDDGQEVPLLAGFKLTGRSNNWNIGALGTLIDEQRDLSERGLGVVRLSRNIGGEGSVGVIATAGRPNNEGFASTYGFDFRLGNSRFFGDGASGSLWGYWLGSQTDGSEGEGTAYGLQGQARTKNWQHNVSFHSVEQGFNPELGFVRRNDVREYRWGSEYTWRNETGQGLFRRASFELEPRLFTDIGGKIQTFNLPFKWLELVLQSEDRLEIESTYETEDIDDSFEVGSGVDVPPGDFEMLRHRIRMRANNRRRIGGEIETEFGDFFDGDLFRFRLNPILLPNKFIQLDAAYSEFHVDIPDGDFVIRLAELGADVDFNPDISWRNLVQYDTESETLGAQSRLRWILSPGREFFLVGLFGWEETSTGALGPTNQDLTLKFTYTLRF